MDRQTIARHTDLRALAEEAGAVFASAYAVCPLHPGADNPTAFHLYTTRDGRQRWHCFTRCPKDQNDGDAIAFYMRWRDVDFKTAKRDLARRCGMSPPRAIAPRLPERKLDVPRDLPASVWPSLRWQSRAGAFLRYTQDQLWSPAGAGARRYLRDERGLTAATLRAWGLGYNPRDWYCPSASWGLDGSRSVWCPRGIVIPTFVGGAVAHVKLRRPLPGDPLAEAIGAVTSLPDVKFCALRGGRAALFGADHLACRPVFLLAEGEFDALLAWQEAHDLCDVASLGGASRRLGLYDLLPLVSARVILVAYDADPAGRAGAAALQKESGRAINVQPPAHDLTAFWRQGGDLRGWIAALVARPPASEPEDEQRCSPHPT